MTSRWQFCGRLVVALTTIGYLVASPASAVAQSGEDARPGFSLASSTIFSTRESPAIYLTFQRVERLDFRIYKVRDPMAFLAGLKDPHTGTSTWRCRSSSISAALRAWSCESNRSTC